MLYRDNSESKLKKRGAQGKDTCSEGGLTRAVEPGVVPGSPRWDEL